MSLRNGPHLSGNGEALITLAPSRIEDVSPPISARAWFAVYTFSCHEKRIAQHCSAREIEHFLPLRRSLTRWKNGCTMLIERPLFPGYIFVNIEKLHRVRVLELPGVQSLVGHGREPVPLPGSEIEILRRGLDQLNAHPCPYLNIGERATIKRGPLQGMTGIVVRRKNGLRLVLSIDLIMKSVSLEIDSLDLEAIPSTEFRPSLLAR
jgi:transcription antitermination factor NusG